MGKTAFDLMHVKGYGVPAGHNKWGYTNGGDSVRTPFKVGGRVALKTGKSADKNWIQKAVNPKHKGFCTPMTKKTCTPKRKALARTFKKMGKARKGNA